MTLGSAHPRTAKMTGRRPRRWIASATAAGKLPPPAIIASGSPVPAAIACVLGVSETIGFAVLGRMHRGMHQRPLAPGTDERNDLLHQRIIGKHRCHLIDPVGE